MEGRFEDALELDLLLETARKLEFEKNFKRAAEYYGGILNIEEKNEDALMGYADCLIELGQKDEARLFYEELIKVSSDKEILEELLETARLYHFDREIKQCYKKLLRIDPNNLSALIEKGINLTKTAKYREAYDIFRNMKNMKLNKEFLFYNAICLEKIGKFKAAIDCYSKIVKIKKRRRISRRI